MTKKIWIILGIIIFILISGYFITHLIVKNKIQNFIENGLGTHVKADYTDLHLNLWNADASIDSLSLRIQNKTDTVVHTSITTSKLALKDFSYTDYLFNDSIRFKVVKISAPEIKYETHKKTATNTTKNNASKPLKNLSIILEKFEIDDAKITLLDEKEERPLMTTGPSALILYELTFTSKSIQQNIPFTYSNIHLKVDSLYLRTSAFDHLRIAQLQASPSDIVMQDLHLLPEYSKTELSAKLNKERDHTTLKIPQSNINQYDFNFKDEQFFFAARQMNITQPDLAIYRDKRVSDDTSTKPLYSKMLRKLPFQLSIDSVHIDQAAVTYEEKIEESQKPGAIQFTNLNMDISNLGNRPKQNNRTELHAEGVFLNSSPVEVDWSFDVQDQQDDFRFAGSLTGLPAKSINSFSVPNLDTAFKGELQEIYFDIDGNNNNSNINMKMKYDDFEVQLLQDGKPTEKDLLSGLANLFVDSESKNNGKDYVNVEASAERDQTKSFFNFIWINIKNALMKIML